MSGNKNKKDHGTIRIFPRDAGDVLIATAALNILSLALPVAILQVYDKVIPNQATPTLIVFVVALGIVLLLDNFLSFGRTKMTSWAGARLQHNLYSEAVKRLFKSDLRAFEAVSQGVHLQRLREVETLKAFFAGQAVLLLVDLPFVVLFLGLIWLMAGPLVLAPVAIIAVLLIIARALGASLSSALEDRVQTDERRYNFVLELLRKIHTLKALGLEPQMVRRYELLQASSARNSLNVSGTSSSARTTSFSIAEITTVSVGAVGSMLVMNGQLTVGGLAASVLLAGRATQPILRALGIWTQFQKAHIGRQQVLDLLSIAQESSPSAPAIHRVEHEIQLHNVSFSYASEKSDLLKNINLTVEIGEVAGVSGPNGSGKSTLLGLAMGLLQPNEGQVLIDGFNAWDFDPISFRRQVCYLPQRPNLFHGTIMDNLVMFRGERYAERALSIAEQLGLHEIVGQLPQGYQTPVEFGENNRIPGGVKQRIALVRAFALVEEPRLILFDEAYTNLDQDSDEKLRNYLAGKRGDCAMIIVSHRPSYLDLADQRYVLRDKTLQPAKPAGQQAIMKRLEEEFAS